MEMKDTKETNGEPKYGTEAGYTMDYAEKKPPPTYDQSEEGSWQGQQQPAAAAGGGNGQPVNPFTQKQYNASTTNPFNR